MSGVFIAGLDTETNSFSPIPTGEQAFQETLLAFGDATKRPLNICSAQLALWRKRAARLGMAVHEGPCAVAQPGGPIPGDFYAWLRGRLLDALQAASPDIVLLALHGAAIAEGEDDVEGDILERARAVLPAGIFLGATLDPHAHLTARMLASASALIAYKEYPHTDVLERAWELMDLALASTAGDVRPAMALWDCRMIGAFPTQTQPMRGFVDSLSAAERADPSIVSLSLIHGFAHGDVADAGARMLAITDGSPVTAASLAEHFGRRFVAIRDEVATRFIDMETALDLIDRKPPGGPPLVLADTGDNPGGGAPGDAVFLLRACIERRVAGVALAMFWDQDAVALCQRAGVGAILDISIGGRFGAISGAPVTLRGARVEATADGLRQRFGDVQLPLGRAIRLTAGALTLIITDHRTQVFDPVCLTGLGADPGHFRAIIVKSANHFTALFEPLASEIHYVATPGATSPRYAEIPYRKRALTYWPRVADPWS
jgi:microcystin degradation protein MlrC